MTSCAIPILALLFFPWIANMLLGIKIDVPVSTLEQRARNARRNAKNTVGTVRNEIKKQKQ